MKHGTISIYNEGVTWLVGLSAAAVGGAFLHYDALGGAPWYARLLFIVVTLFFLAAVGVGVHYAFWLYHVINQQEREERLQEESLSEKGPVDALEYYRQREAIKKKIEEARTQLEKLHKYLLRSFSLGVAGAAVILVLAVSTVKAHPANMQDSSEKNRGQVTVRFSDQVEKAVLDHLTNDAGASGTGPTSTNGTVKLDPELEAALRVHLRSLPPSNNRTAWIILLVVGVSAGIVLIAWALGRKPEASPLAVAVSIFGALTAFIVKLAAQKPTLPLGHFPFWVVAAALTSVVAAVALIGTAIIGLLAVPNAKEERTEKDRQGLLATSHLVFGFSAILLALVPALLFNGEAVHSNKEGGPQSRAASTMPTGEISVWSLSGINELGDGGKATDPKIDPGRIQNLIKEAGAHGAQGGDILLLLGSADCIPTKPGGLWKGNEELERARAKWVKDGLDGKPELSGISLQTSPLPAYSGCRKSPDVRAVYPFLIHGEQNQTTHP